MGGLIARFKKESEPDDEENLRKYQMKIDSDGTFGYSDELDKRRILWWETLLFDKRLRIVYALILGLILGILIPMILFMTALENKSKMVFGSCLIHTDARFECLINSVQIVDEKSCMAAMCCWENDETLLYKCYHSLPSAYHYTLSGNQTNDECGTMKLNPNRDMESIMSTIQTSIHYESQPHHLVIEIFDPNKERNKVYPTRRKTSTLVASEEQENPFKVNCRTEGEIFYIEVVRSETNETLFDTRLGPIILTETYISLATVLPTKYFYGLKGGQGSFSTLTYVTVNGFENLELPFYISYEKSGMWHGVLIDTDEPMLVQVVQAPGISFHIETSEMNLHFFAGPGLAEITSQVHNFIRTKHAINHPPFIPPYWGLGLHLCRKVENSSVVLEDIKHLFKVAKSLPFDSDCISENLRQPFEIDEEKFPQSNLTEILDFLEEKAKRILLHQKVSAPADYDSKLNASAWIMKANNNSTLFPNPSDLISFLGDEDNMTVKYMNFFNSELQNFPLIVPSETLEIDMIETAGGIVINDNFPRLYDTSICNEPETRIQSWFSSPRSSSNGSHLNTTSLWSSVCPEALHLIDVDLKNEENENQSPVKHMKLHNIFGERSLKLTYDTFQNASYNVADMLFSSNSVWLSSPYYGAFNGLEVPFTYQGLQESVAHIVRNFALIPISGTPICGSHVFNLNITYNDDLCLRWFQFGLLLPMSINSYDGVSSYGAVHLSEQYKDYLSEAIRTRYMLSPYYFTTLRQYQRSLLPFIRPMSFQLTKNEAADVVLPIINQFMIGDSILAAPIIDRDVTRSAYFPAGLWYSMEGMLVWDKLTGGVQRVLGLISDTPIFIKGGRIIPTLEHRSASSIGDSLEKPYTLHIALSERNAESTSTAEGMLTVKSNSTDSDFHEVQFSATYFQTNYTLHVIIKSKCANLYKNDNYGKYEENMRFFSTTIDQLRILSFPVPPDKENQFRFHIILKSAGKDDEEFDCSQIDADKCDYYGDHNSLRVKNLNIEWCKADIYEVIVQPTS